MSPRYRYERQTTTVSQPFGLPSEESMRQRDRTRHDQWDYKLYDRVASETVALFNDPVLAGRITTLLNGANEQIGGAIEKQQPPDQQEIKELRVEYADFLRMLIDYFGAQDAHNDPMTVERLTAIADHLDPDWKE